MAQWCLSRIRRFSILARVFSHRRGRVFESRVAHSFFGIKRVFCRPLDKTLHQMHGKCTVSPSSNLDSLGGKTDAYPKTVVPKAESHRQMRCLISLSIFQSPLGLLLAISEDVFRIINHGRICKCRPVELVIEWIPRFLWIKVSFVNRYSPIGRIVGDRGKQVRKICRSGVILIQVR
jgi:hypothetical protein